MPTRSQVYRSAVRRSGGILSINGLTGAISLLSPMLSTSGNTLRIDNKNIKTLTDAATITGVDVTVNNAFQVTLGGNRTMDKPSGTPIQDGEVITFRIEQGAGAPHTLVFDTGANGYRFANAASPNGTTLTQFNNLLAATPLNSYLRIGFEFHEADGFWDAVALAGFWP